MANVSSFDFFSLFRYCPFHTSKTASNSYDTETKKWRRFRELSQFLTPLSSQTLHHAYGFNLFVLSLIGISGSETSWPYFKGKGHLQWSAQEVGPFCLLPSYQALDLLHRYRQKACNHPLRWVPLYPSYLIICRDRVCLEWRQDKQSVSGIHNFYWLPSYCGCPTYRNYGWETCDLDITRVTWNRVCDPSSTTMARSWEIRRPCEMVA